jgi:hypothetical protein
LANFDIHLISFGKKCAIDIGVPLMMGILSGERTEAKVRLYCRQFGTPAGAFFLSNAGSTALTSYKPQEFSHV